MNVNVGTSIDPILETERLILRRPIVTDLDSWAEFAADAANMRFIGGALGRFGAWRSMTITAGSWALQGYGMFSVIERATGKWIGRLGPWQPAGWPGPEIGWSLTREAQGKGYAYEGTTAAIDFAVDILGWTSFIHCIDTENHPSAALAARLGSRNLGPGQLPPPYDSDIINLWGQTAAEWKTRAVKNAR
jgi:RimJ/RimL family protein N-acetyltransferase